MTLAKFVVIITIALTTIAVALIVGAVILMEKEQKRGGVLHAPSDAEFHVADKGPEIVVPLNRYQNRYRMIVWTPVEERLPENASRVLVTIGTMVDRGELVTTTDVYYPLSEKWGNYNGGVVAWAKLPEPYKK